MRKYFSHTASSNRFVEGQFTMENVDNIHLVTKIRKNMKDSQMDLYEKMPPGKPSCIRIVPAMKIIHAANANLSCHQHHSHMKSEKCRSIYFAFSFFIRIFAVKYKSPFPMADVVQQCCINSPLNKSEQQNRSLTDEYSNESQEVVEKFR